MFVFRATTQNFSPAIIEIDAAMRAGPLRHDGNPVLEWCLGNVTGKAQIRPLQVFRYPCLGIFRKICWRSAKFDRWGNDDIGRIERCNPSCSWSVTGRGKSPVNTGVCASRMSIFFRDRHAGEVGRLRHWH
jgi:hypothetical protein